MLFPVLALHVSCQTLIAQPPSQRRLLAIGDLHADVKSSILVLELAGILDKEHNWIAEDTIVVQTGDLTDRGPDGKETLAFIKKLEEQALQKNGQLITLIGNHEAMNLMGDWRYVSTKDVESFGGKDKRIEAFSDGGTWREWIIQHDTVVKVQGNIFVHGGVTPEFAQKGIDGINQEVRESLKSQQRSDILGSSGPLWFRGYLRDSEAVACPMLEETLALLKAKRMIVGHTTQRSGQIMERCGGKLIGIDTGISAHYGSNFSDLDLSNNDARALYQDNTKDIADPK